MPGIRQVKPAILGPSFRGSTAPDPNRASCHAVAIQIANPDTPLPQLRSRHTSPHGQRSKPRVDDGRVISGILPVLKPGDRIRLPPPVGTCASRCIRRRVKTHHGPLHRRICRSRCRPTTQDASDMA